MSTTLSIRIGLVVLMCLGVLGQSSVAEARTVIRSGEIVTINVDQTVAGDFYAVANTLSAIGSITEDVVLVGGRITLGGTVGHDVLVTGGTVAINASVGDDVRVLAGDVTVTGPIAGDLVVMGGSLTVLSSATVGGDIVFYGGRMEMNGQVSGDIIGTVDRLRLDGIVGGAVDVTTSTLTLGDRAQVTGIVRYTSATPLVRGQGAIVEGEIIRNAPTSATSEIVWRTVLIPLLVIIFSLLAWQLISPRTLMGLTLETSRLPLRAALIGFGLFFLTPVLVSVLVVSVLGTVVGLIVFLLYLTACMLSVIAAGAGLGQVLARYSGQSTYPLGWSIIGTIILYGCVFIPLVGPAIVLGIVILTLGVVAEQVFRLLR